MDINVKLTEDHIKNGNRNSPNSCPIALSLKSLGFKYVDVANTFVDADWKFYVLPKEARDFIVRFDKGEEVSPIEFTLTQNRIIKTL